MRKILIAIVAVFYSSGVFADCTFVSGTIVNETWTAANSPYCVVGNILVSNLVIEPGVHVSFLGGYVFEVAGVLTAIGTEQDSIKFTKADTADAWQGIFFNFSQIGSELAYCIIDSSANRGILVDNSSPLIRNSTIRHNSSSGRGGGIRSNSPLTLIDCKIVGNKTISQFGGGIYSEGPLTLIRCTILHNSIFLSLTSNFAAGAGIYSAGGLFISNSYIEENLARSINGNPYQSATAVGGGIYLWSGSLSLTNCIIRYNEAHAGANTAAEIARGGGIYLREGTASLTNCILSDNSLETRLYWGGSAATGGGIHVNGGSITFTNCTIAYNEYDGIFRNGGTVAVKNSIIWENDGGADQIIGTTTVTYSDVQGGYSGIGNINLNPIFLNNNSCLHIVPGSPCIDAGDSSAIYNDSCFCGPITGPSWGTARNDMGAHGGPGACNWASETLCGCIITAIHDDTENLTTQFSLYQNYPNPFNPTTTMTYELPKSEHVHLTVYNMLGQEIVTLVNEKQAGGVYRVQWNGRNQEGMPAASGVYLYRLRAGEFAETRKMLLLR